MKIKKVYLVMGSFYDCEDNKYDKVLLHVFDDKSEAHAYAEENQKLVDHTEHLP